MELLCRNAVTLGAWYFPFYQLKKYFIFSKTVNVAINKPTFQQYPVLDDDRFDSSNAVDGHKSDLGEDGGQCAVSA